MIPRARGLAVAVISSSIFALSSLCCASDIVAHPEMLVSTAWLADHLNDANVVVLQVGHDRSAYQKEHIPTARFLSTNDFTTGHTGLMVELPTVEKLRQSFEELGINDDTRVVVYTTDWYPVASRAFFTLDYFGHTNTALLDGSLAQWKAENRPVTADERGLRFRSPCCRIPTPASMPSRSAMAATSSCTTTTHRTDRR